MFLANGKIGKIASSLVFFAVLTVTSCRQYVFPMCPPSVWEIPGGKIRTTGEVKYSLVCAYGYTQPMLANRSETFVCKNNLRERLPKRCIRKLFALVTLEFGMSIKIQANRTQDDDICSDSALLWKIERTHFVRTLFPQDYDWPGCITPNVHRCQRFDKNTNLMLIRIRNVLRGNGTKEETANYYNLVISETFKVLKAMIQRKGYVFAKFLHQPQARLKDTKPPDLPAGRTYGLYTFLNNGLLFKSPGNTSTNGGVAGFKRADMAKLLEPDTGISSSNPPVKTRQSPSTNRHKRDEDDTSSPRRAARAAALPSSVVVPLDEEEDTDGDANDIGQDGGRSSDNVNVRIPRGDFATSDDHRRGANAFERDNLPGNGETFSADTNVSDPGSRRDPEVDARVRDRSKWLLDPTAGDHDHEKVDDMTPELQIRLKRLWAEQKKFDRKYRGLHETAEPGKPVGHECPDHLVLREGEKDEFLCVGCGKGWILHTPKGEKAPRCFPCGPGYFNPLETATECLPCPIKYTTAPWDATSFDDCFKVKIKDEDKTKWTLFGYVVPYAFLAIVALCVVWASKISVGPSNYNDAKFTSNSGRRASFKSQDMSGITK